MFSSTLKPIFASAARNLGAVTAVSALSLSLMLSNAMIARADAPVAAKPTSGSPVVHRMVVAPVWSTDGASAPYVGSIVTHATAKHATHSKPGAFDVIESPIWPVTPPDDGDGSGSGC